jgi:hypothetical protein
MRKGILILAAIASITLVGCGTRPFYHPGVKNPFLTTQTCDKQACDVNVTINDCAAGNMTVADILDMTPGPSGQQRTITWTITNESGYEFSKESFKYGIFIKLDGGDEFKNAQVNGKTVTIKYDKKAVTGTSAYSYALTVRRTDGDKNFCKTLDPWMIT